MGCTVRAALYKRSALMPARSQREPAGSASASRWLRQHSASASRWLRSLAPCMHSATLRQRFALAPRSSSPQSALRAACCDPRCLHTGPLNPRCVAALRAAAVTVTACGSSRSAIDRGTLEACRWNSESGINLLQTSVWSKDRTRRINLGGSPKARPMVNNSPATEFPNLEELRQCVTLPNTRAILSC